MASVAVKSVSCLTLLPVTVPGPDDSSLLFSSYSLTTGGHEPDVNLEKNPTLQMRENGSPAATLTLVLVSLPLYKTLVWA